MGARPKLNQARRRQTLEAAVEVIAERGICETRVADVAERAGLSAALILYYFGSKEQLLTDALTFAEDRFYLDTFHELTGIEGAPARLVRLIELSCPPQESSGVLDGDWRLWIELWSRALRDPEAGRKREALDRRWRSTIADVIREGQGSGEFAAVDADDLATSLAALIDGLALQVLFEDPGMTSERMRSLCLRMVERELGLEPLRPEKARSH